MEGRDVLKIEKNIFSSGFLYLHENTHSETIRSTFRASYEGVTRGTILGCCHLNESCCCDTTTGQIALSLLSY